MTMIMLTVRALAMQWTLTLERSTSSMQTPSTSGAGGDVPASQQIAAANEDLPRKRRKITLRERRLQETMAQTRNDLTSDAAVLTALDAEWARFTTQEGAWRVDECVFSKWRSLSSVYPLLSIVARKYLAAPGAQVCCERLFNPAGDLITKKRTRMAPRRVRASIRSRKNGPKVGTLLQNAELI